MVYALIGIDIIFLLYNIIKNKKFTLTMGLLLLEVLVTCIVNYHNLSMVAQDEFVGINYNPFILMSCILTIIAVIIQMKKKYKERILSFICMILFTLTLISLRSVLFGGLMLSGEEYFRYNLNEYLFCLALSIIPINFFVNWIAQEKTKE